MQRSAHWRGIACSAGARDERMPLSGCPVDA